MGRRYVGAMARPLAIAVLVSGSGTNLQAVLDAIATGRLDATIRVVLSNVAGVAALTRAERAGVPTLVIDHRGFPGREAFDTRIVQVLRERQVDLVVLAGFNRLLSPVLIRAFPMAIINIHPALLPAFPGLHAQRQAVAYGVRIAGATVHFVDEETDHGPIIIQAAVPVLPNDDEQSLGARILAEEHRIYPEAIQLLAEGRVRVVGRQVIVADVERPSVTGLANPPVRAAANPPTRLP
jgi:phosphoribosylglycinamide formyltransferase-1